MKKNDARPVGVCSSMLNVRFLLSEYDKKPTSANWTVIDRVVVLKGYIVSKSKLEASEHFSRAGMYRSMIFLIFSLIIAA